MSTLPLISIITPVYNASQTLADCIESVACQHYPKIEHWLIDGKSTDNSIEIIEAYQEKFSHIHYISEKDTGIYDAMNKGIRLSTGNFLLFIGADDKLCNDVLQNIFLHTDATELDIIHGKVQANDHVYGNVFQYDSFCQSLQMEDEPIIHHITHHQGTFIHRRLFNEYGEYDTEKYKIGADIYFFIQVLSNKKTRIQFTDTIVAEFGKDGISGQTHDFVLRNEYPYLINKYFHVTIPVRKYYRILSKYYFEKIYLYNFWEGFTEIVKIAFKTREFVYYFKNTMFWIKQRLLKKHESV